jgi:hypothetical protein
MQPRSTAWGALEHDQEGEHEDLKRDQHQEDRDRRRHQRQERQDLD